MNKLFKIRLLPLMCVILSIAMIAACKKNVDTASDKIVLLSFGPTGAKHGDTLKFIGNNLNQVTEIAFTGAVVAKAGFVSQTSELVLVVVPNKAEKGFVTLKTPQGDIVTKTRLNLSVTAKVATMTAQARPGENITLTGDFMNWVRWVSFSKDKVVNTFVSQSLNQLVIKVPDDAQTGPLVIYYAGTDSMELETKDTLKVSLPVVTGFATNPVKHAENVTLTGTNLDLTKQVLFSGVSAPVTTFVSQSATQLVVKVPASTTKGKVTLVAASGQKTTSATDLDVLLPAFTSFAPSPIDPLADLTIVGTDFDLVSSVTFSNAPAVTSFISQSNTQIVVKVPNGVARGKVILGVKNSTLTVASNDVLEITGDVPAPTIALPFYKDAVTANWNGWVGGGWGGNKDYNNSTPVREGNKSIKIDYVGGYGSPVQLGGGNVVIGSYTTFKVSIFGAPGSAGKRINIGINASDAYTINLVEGKWTDYSIPISSLTSASKFTEIWIKEYSGTGGFTIYVDAMGLN